MCVPFVGVSVFVKTVDDPVFLGAVFVIAPPHLLRQHQRQFVDGGGFRSYFMGEKTAGRSKVTNSLRLR